MPHRIVFPSPQHVILEPFDSEPPSPGMVGVRSLWSLMSIGTENIAFNQAFSAGTHWAAFVTYPFLPGYATVGLVEEVGAGVTSPAPGDLVYLATPHASHHVVTAESCSPVGENVDAKQAPWCALAGVAFVAARNAGCSLGDSVLVIGAGPIGQMSVRWARAAGLQRILVVDPMPMRLGLAQQGGATSVVDSAIAECMEAVRAANDGQLPSVVIDATGNASVFAEALKLVGFGGRLVLVGDPGSPELQHLTSDVLTRGLTIVGSHGSHLAHVLGLAQGDPFAAGLEALLATHQLASRHFAEIFFDLVRAGQFDLEGLVTHEFSPEQCEEAYTVANERRGEAMGILFDWTGTSGGGGLG